MHLVKSENHAPQTITQETQMMSKTSKATKLHMCSFWYRGSYRTVFVSLPANEPPMLTQDEVLAIFKLAVPDYQQGDVVCFTLKQI